MQCEAVRQQIAYYRELTEGEREAVQRHLDNCPVCMAIWEQYQSQDRVLASLPDVVPSRDFAARVRGRTVDSPKRGSRLGRRLVTNLAIMALALIVVFGGTIGVSAQALPGSQLYPVKLAVEQARMTLTIGEENRQAYQAELDETRRQEAIAVADRDDVAPVAVAFQGTLTGVSGNAWIVDGVEVEVAPELAAAGAALVGQRVAVDAEAGGGVIAASAVFVQPTPTLHLVARPTSTDEPATNAPTASPIPPSATAVAKATATPILNAVVKTATALDLRATAAAKLTPSAAAATEADEPTAEPRVTRRVTRPAIVIQPTDEPTKAATKNTEPAEPTAVQPTPRFTRIATILATPRVTRVATPRITRVAPPAKEVEPTPTAAPTWVATKSPTQGSSESPTMAPTTDATPTLWTKPVTPTPDWTQAPPTETPLYKTPTPLPPTPTPGYKVDTVEPTATHRATSTPLPTEPPTATPQPSKTPQPTKTQKPNDVPTPTPKSPTSTPASSGGTAPTATPANRATPKPSVSPEYQRVPEQPPTMAAPPAYPLN